MRPQPIEDRPIRESMRATYMVRRPRRPHNGIPRRARRSVKR